MSEPLETNHNNGTTVNLGEIAKLIKEFEKEAEHELVKRIEETEDGIWVTIDEIASAKKLPKSTVYKKIKQKKLITKKDKHPRTRQNVIYVWVTGKLKNEITQRREMPHKIQATITLDRNILYSLYLADVIDGRTLTEILNHSEDSFICRVELPANILKKKEIRFSWGGINDNNEVES